MWDKNIKTRKTKTTLRSRSEKAAGKGQLTIETVELVIRISEVYFELTVKNEYLKRILFYEDTN